MATIKRLIIISVSFGIGFAVTVALIIAGFMWYQSRPKLPKPWNPNAMIATYDYIDVEGQDNNFVFYYTLENRTDIDYKISESSDVIVMGKLEKQKSLTGDSKGEDLKPDHPILIPAKERIRFGIHLGYPYKKKMKEGSTKEEKKQYREELRKYVSEELPNLDGFVLFDERNRYQIDFPGGWKK
jgi:hypothetical protein